MTPASAEEIDYERLKERINQYKNGMYRELIPDQIIKRVQSLNFLRVKETGWSWDFETYYAQMDKAALDIVCGRKLVSNIEVENIEDFFNSLQRAIVRTSPQVKCGSSLKDAITLDSLNTIFDQLKSDKKFRNSSPGGQCFSRTYLISKKLNDLGVASKQLIVNGWIIGAFEFEGYYGVEGYDIHNANIVNVVVNGSIIPYVVDPMFFDSPIPLNEYKQNISVDEIRNNYKVVPQTFQYMDYYPGKEISENVECSYNEASLILESNQIEDILTSVKQSDDHFYYNDERGIYPQIREDKVTSRDEAISLYRKRLKKIGEL